MATAKGATAGSTGKLESSPESPINRAASDSELATTQQKKEKERKVGRASEQLDTTGIPRVKMEPSRKLFQD